MSVQTFWLEPTDDVAVGLHRYSRRDSAADGWTCADGWHQALVYTGTETATYETRDGHRVRVNGLEFEVDKSDPAWPATCAEGCGYVFTDDDRWQRWTELLYRRTDTGELRVLHQGAPAPDAPSAEPGASWNAWWMPSSWRRADGIYLMVRLPDGHDWAVDSQASNCTRKGEPHECWVRHGDPRKCRVTVDKNGDTCSAGAGSIDSGTWHGFLRNGQLA